MLKRLFVLLIGMASWNVCAMEVQDGAPVLPTVYSRSPFTIPDNFKSLSDLGFTNEYIPSIDEQDNWTEKITTNGSLLSTASARKMLELNKKTIAFFGSKVQLREERAEETINEEGSYEVATCLRTYKYNTRREIMGIKYISGSNFCFGVLYTIAISSAMPETKAHQKIINYINSQTLLLPAST